MTNENHGTMTNLGNGYFRCEICGREVLWKDTNNPPQVIVEGNYQASHSGAIAPVGVTLNMGADIKDPTLEPFEKFMNELERKNAKGNY